MSVASEDPHLSLLKQDLAAIAIVFDFVNRVLALWRLPSTGEASCGSMNLRRDTRNIMQHAKEKARRILGTGASFRAPEMRWGKGRVSKTISRNGCSGPNAIS